ncbi:MULTISPECIES: hypothetical protein [Thiorhodovibrio]|uniref:hypothetical protein n=1 Tax=Thiorhodovibrio TaxID=61593 RepID=UPI001913EBC3|nr:MULTISPECIES: hypothetical protein [Thiorhodovibrio]
MMSFFFIVFSAVVEVVKGSQKLVRSCVAICILDQDATVRNIFFEIKRQFFAAVASSQQGRATGREKNIFQQLRPMTQKHSRLWQSIQTRHPEAFSQQKNKKALQSPQALGLCTPCFHCRVHQGG